MSEILKRRKTRSKHIIIVKQALKKLYVKMWTKLIVVQDEASGGFL
jgi:hypothetical protein